ncbi:MAG: RNase adapter RapZ [Lachnospiraceae bacterium]|nr:RNase adapter RapZ [Lachnospiraceae bacterium]
MRLVVVTGMSGAGKSSVLNMLEDSGFYCVDNLPIPLIMDFIRVTSRNPELYEKVALGVDIRSGFVENPGFDTEELLCALNSMENKAEILFLDSGDEALIKRYKETRRTHPLAGTDRIEEGIKEERKRIGFLKAHADFIIDTSNLLIRDLKKQIEEIFVEGKGFKNFIVTVLSFGYKYGIPTDADLVFDVRFLNNPYYIPELKKLTGETQEVKDFVMASESYGEFMDRLSGLIQFLIPHYMEEGKNGLVVAIGCTGGKHRSVTVTEKMAAELEDNGFSVKMYHRDINK